MCGNERLPLLKVYLNQLKLNRPQQQQLRSNFSLSDYCSFFPASILLIAMCSREKNGSRVTPLALLAHTISDKKIILFGWPWLGCLFFKHFQTIHNFILTWSINGSAQCFVSTFEAVDTVGDFIIEKKWQFFRLEVAWFDLKCCEILLDLRLFLWKYFTFLKHFCPHFFPILLLMGLAGLGEVPPPPEYALRAIITIWKSIRTRQQQQLYQIIAWKCIFDY